MAKSRAGGSSTLCGRPGTAAVGDVLIADPFEEVRQGTVSAAVTLEGLCFTYSPRSSARSPTFRPFGRGFRPDRLATLLLTSFFIGSPSHGP